MGDFDDTFTGTNGDSPSTDLWEVIANPGDYFSIYSNTYRLSRSTYTVSSEKWVYETRGKFYFDGDFEIQIDFTRTSWSNSSGSWQYGGFGLITEAGVWEILASEVYSSYTTRIGAYASYSSGSPEYLKERTASSGVIGKIKFKRVSGVITAYQWDTIDSNWQWDNSEDGYSGFITIGSARVFPYLRVVYQGKAASITPVTTYDNFLVNSGTAEFPPIEGEQEEDIGVEAETEAEATYNVEIDEGAGVKAESDADSPYVVEDEGVGVHADADANGIYSPQDIAWAVVEAASDAYILTVKIEENAGVESESDVLLESYPVHSLGVGVSVEADAYNFSQWVRENGSNSTKVFIFTLTGAADGLEDITIPISSFQARKKNGDPTYLSVVIPSFNYAEDITARPNGDMVVSAGYRVNGAISLLEEILRGTLSDITTYDGPRSQTITLTGYKMQTFAQKTVTLEKSSFTFVNYGKTRRRFGEVDLFLNPGDYLTVDGGTYEVGEISYTVNTDQQSMEVIEA